MSMSRVLLILCLLFLASSIAGCSDSKNNQQSATDDVNLLYQNYLQQGRYVDLPAAQPRFPASGELFSENTGIFDLVAADQETVQKKLSKALMSDFALYAPAAPASKSLASAIAGTTPGSSLAGIPSLKGQNAIPGSCAELTGDEFQECLAEFGVEPLLSAPGTPQEPAPPDHVSMHDPQTLAIEIGPSVVDSIAGKTIRTLTTNVTKARRDAIVARLSDLTNDDAAHANLDLASLDPFNPSGYSLNSVVVTDGSSSYVNDGGFARHSTMITEVAKPVNYHRSPAPALDACVQRYGGNIVDRYVVKVTTYVHLDSLAPQRQQVSLPVAAAADAAVLPEAYEAAQRAEAINNALDANVIKWVYGSAGNLPESATEYTLSFQLDADLISNEYRQVIEEASDAGDSACQEVVEQHVNPRTAIIGRVTPAAARSVQKKGDAMNVFYQVPSSFSRELTAKVAAALTGETVPPSSLEPLRDYCMVDGTGRKVSIIDPASGAVVPACEKFSQAVMAKTVLMTKSGACRDDRGHWAYYPSRIRTERFGRGIQWILTEWFLHNQVGDYKNIHWYQNAWKSGVQVAVKGAKYVFATYLKIQLGAIKPKADEKRSTYYIKSLLPLVKDVVMKMNGMNVAGYRVSIPSTVGNFLSGAGGYSGSGGAFGNSTFDTQLALEMRQGATGFLVDRLTDAAAQMVDVSATGWQDISDRSHYGCFQFSY